ncbi:MAG: DNA/RNA nuclease SfsA [Candidatus Heimdallarchaeaceae archaeon]
MKLEETYIKARFLRRPNRFLAYVVLEEKNEEVKAHVPDPGRLKELFLPNAFILLRKESKAKRKTAFTVVGIKTGEIWVNIESIFTNQIFLKEYKKIEKFKEYVIVRAEISFGNSRFDFLLQHKKTKKFALVEVKGVTLVKKGLALFPDAPTMRGAKHVIELVKALKEGYESHIVFIIKRKDAEKFKANEETDKIFAQELRKAISKGVNITVVKCNYDPLVKNEINIIKEIPFVQE